jgi:hypothetical protein
MKPNDHSASKPALSKVLIQTLVPAGVGLIFHFLDHLVAAKVLWGVSGLLLLSGLFVPFVFNKIEQFGRWFGKWVGVIVTWVLMVPMFWLIFVPGRVILKLRGIDPMCRKFPTDEKTYWVPRKPVSNMDDYKRQF